MKPAETTGQALLELCKPRIVQMVLVTAAVGYVLGSHGDFSWFPFLAMLVGTGVAVAGSGALNNYLERDFDARMERTRTRAIPSGKVTPATALSLGSILVLVGISLLVWQVNLLCGFLVLLGAFLYVLVYTPMKRITWTNTMVGAIPGAIPPMAGWAAASGNVEPGAWALFAILYIWQHPHFYAIAWMYREDYERAGFKMIPLGDPTGERTFRHIAGFSVALVIASMLPVLTGSLGTVYLVGVLLLGVFVFKVGRELAVSASNFDARRLLRASIIYLPVWLLLTVVDISL